MAEMKQFSKTTELRLKIEEVLAPIIASVEEHTNALIKRSKELEVSGERIKYVIGLCDNLQLKIDEKLVFFNELRVKFDQSLLQNAAQQQSHEEAHQALGERVDQLQTELNLLRARGDETTELLSASMTSQRTNLSRHQKNIESLQGKFMACENDVTEKSNAISAECNRIREEFMDMQRVYDSEIENLKYLQNNITIYDSDKPIIRRRLKTLEDSMLLKASLEDLQLYKVRVSCELRNSEQKLENILQESLSEEVRSELPYVRTVVTDVKQLEESMKDRTARLDKLEAELLRVSDEQIPDEVGRLLAKIKLQQDQRKEMTQQVARQAQQQLGKAIHTLDLNLRELTFRLLEDEQRRATDEVVEVRTQLERQIAGLLWERREQVYRLSRQLMPIEQQQFMASLRSLKPQILQVKEQLLKKVGQIERLATDLNQTLQQFAGRITITRTDNEIKTEQCQKQINSINKQTALFKEQFERVGRILLTAFQAQNVVLAALVSLEEQEKARSKEGYTEFVFANVSEGLLYEAKENKEFCYRKSDYSRYDLLRFNFAAFVDFQDSVQSDQFLRGQGSKPGDFFRGKVQELRTREQLRLEGDESSLSKTRRGDDFVVGLVSKVRRREEDEGRSRARQRNEELRK